MNKHDKVNFSWDNSPEDYYRKRIESLEKENEKCRRMLEMNKSYTDKLEKALAKSADRCARVERALVEEKIGNVQM